MESKQELKKIAAIILENPQKEVLLYLRDDKPNIPFPAHWDYFGGMVDEGETPEEALIRELKEELNLDFTPDDFTLWKEIECLEGDAFPNIKYVYTGTIDVPIEEITLLEGQYPQYFSREELKDLKFANILGDIMKDYVAEHP